MKQVQINIGCSAFNNIHWKGVFYPDDLPRSKWFDFYAQHFNTYELNSSFYKTPTVRSLRSWYQKAPSDFLFSVKAPRNITHYKRFVNIGDELSEFYATCRNGLNEKLACVLFQCPPSFAFAQEKLDLIIETVNPEFTNVIEFRHPSWWNQQVYDELKANNIVFCNVSYPNLPENLVATTGVGYIRLHGQPKLFYSNYSDADLERYRIEIQKQNQWKSVFFYFNNTADVYGITNAAHFSGNDIM